MRSDSLLGPVVHRAKFQGAFERSPSPFNFCKPFVMYDSVCTWRIHISGLEKQDAIYLFLQIPALPVGLDDDLILGEFNFEQ